MSRFRLYGSISVIALSVLLAMPSQAQTPDASPQVTEAAPQATQAPPQPGEAIDVVVVTAQKREEDLQDVPIVVTAVGEQLLRDAGVDNIKDLQVLTPGLTVTSTSSEASTTARIRGVGTVGDNLGLESSVLVNVDGVYRPRNGVGFGDLGELKRVEVLKGPQGTLFGKNASAGVINVITAQPTFDFQVKSEVTGGNYGAFGGSVSVNGPIIPDKLAGRVFLAKRARDGFLNIQTGPGPRGEKDDVDQNYYTARGQLLAEPFEGFSARLILDYTLRDENCCGATQLFVGQAANSRANFINAVRPGSIDTVATPFDRNALANNSTMQKITDQGVSLEMNWDAAEDVLVTSITAIRDWRSVNGSDVDYTAADLVYRPNDGTNRSGFYQVSQELRASGEWDKLTWLVGAFWAREDVESRLVLTTGTDFFDYFIRRVLGGAPLLIGITPGTAMQPGTGYRDYFDQNGETIAIFTENTYDFTDQLGLTLGLRWTRDDKRVGSIYTTTGTTCDQGEAGFGALAGAVGAATATAIVGGLCVNGFNNDFDELGRVVQKRNEEAVTGTARIKYDLTPDNMIYGSYARGFKSGGFNLDREGVVLVTPTGPNFAADPDTSFPGEYVDAFEIGAKNRLFNNSLTFNIAAFHQTYEDFQLNTFIGTAFVVETLPEVISKGIDADFAWRTPWEPLTIQGGLTYADTKISEFTAADLTNPARFNSLRRLPGATLSFAPEWSGTLSATYEQPIGDNLLVRANFATKYMSDYNTGSDLHPVKEQEAYAVVNARVGIGADNDLWMLELWAENLFDEDYLQVGFNGPFQVDENNDSVSVYDAFLASPATYGVTLRTQF